MEKTGGGDAVIWGLHAVAAAIVNPRRRINRVSLTRNAAIRIGLDPDALPRFAALAASERISAAIPGDAVHQGACAWVGRLLPRPFEEIVALEEGTLLVLDAVTDPGNVGAIFRSAAAFGASAIVMQSRRAPKLEGTLAKAASGAAEQVDEVRVVNIARAVRAFADAGWHMIGLAEQADRDLADSVIGRGRLALVLGAEGSGLRANVAAACSCLARISVTAGMPSLNVSTAAAVALYEAARSRRSSE